MPSDKKFAVVTLVPAIHIGYINFFKKYPGTLYVIGKDFIQDFPHIERDLRTPDFSELKKMLESLEIFSEVIELTRENVKNIPADAQIVMPDDEVAKGIAEKYLKEREVKYENIFLRWNRQISTTEFEVPIDRVISHDEADRELIGQAQTLSEKSSDWWRQIGTLVVKDGKVLVTGFNCHLPTDMNMDSFGDPRSNFDAGIRFDLSTAIHSEARAIAEAARKGISVDEASLYVTTFPCPSCAKLLAVAGIRRVYYSSGYSLLDAETILNAFGVEIVLVK